MASVHVLAAFSFLSLVAIASAVDVFSIEGKVYCDNCRAGFETTITEYVTGAKVRLECKNITTDELVRNIEGETDSTGTYKIKVVDDHEEEICEVVLVSSPNKECNEIKTGRDRAMVHVTDNSGLTSNVIFANSLGFLRTEPLAICGELLAQYNMNE